MKWENLREEEFEDAIRRSGGVCVMALGCLEKHGEHLPVGTDSLKGDKIVELAAQKADVMMFPTSMWLGDVSSSHAWDNPESIHKHGFIGINPSTLLTVFEELCDEIARNGFTKIVFLNSHGGNRAILDTFMRSQSYKKKKYATMWTGAYFLEDLAPRIVLETVNKNRADFDMLTDDDIKTLEKFAALPDSLTVGHGGFCETALVYGTHPDTVAPTRFDSLCGISTHRADYLQKEKINFYYSWASNYPNNLNGVSSEGCNERIGKAMVKISVDRLARIFEMLKHDEEVLNMVNEGINS